MSLLLLSLRIKLIICVFVSISRFSVITACNHQFTESDGCVLIATMKTTQTLIYVLDVITTIGTILGIISFESPHQDLKSKIKLLLRICSLVFTKHRLKLCNTF